MASSLVGAVAAAVFLVTGWAYGHADWPNGRPDDPSRGAWLPVRVFVDARGVTEASVAH